MTQHTVRYLVIIEAGEHNYGGYVPDLPGCVTTGHTPEEVVANLREAIAFHLEGMLEDGEKIPAPTVTADYVEVDVPVAPASSAAGGPA